MWSNFETRRVTSQIDRLPVGPTAQDACTDRAAVLRWAAGRARLVAQPAKDEIRLQHALQRAGALQNEQAFIQRWWPRLKSSFADGDSLDLQRLRPTLEPVQADQPSGALFRLASLLWSAPVSRGFGRRIRFLVRDERSGALLGLIGLTDPVFNLKARDDAVGWTGEMRRHRLVHVMDAFVLGAVPPFNAILGGKLIACLLRTRDVKAAFDLKYGHRPGLISKTQKDARLTAVTTASALGRSSVYNRLSISGRIYLESLGYSSGFGHFHVPENVFQALRRITAAAGREDADAFDFGQGPSWRFRVIRAGLRALELDQSLLHHGVRRELFISRLASNTDAFLCGEEDSPCFPNLESADAVAGAALERWVLPRAARDPVWRNFRREHLLHHLSV